MRKVSTGEIKNIGGRLRLELRDKNIPINRKIEVESLLNHIDTWLEWKANFDLKIHKQKYQNER